MLLDTCDSNNDEKPLEKLIDGVIGYRILPFYVEELCIIWLTVVTLQHRFRTSVGVCFPYM